MFNDFLGKNWAQPVVSKPWACIASILFSISELSGYRILNKSKSDAWRMATGTYYE